MTRRAQSTGALLLGLFCIWGCSKAPAFLPRKDEIQNLKPSGSLKCYRGQTLYVYINGGADLFHEYGFQRLWVQTYKNSDREIVLEAYEMTDGPGAAGIYSHMRRPGSEQALTTGLASVTETQVLATRDRFTLVVRAGDMLPGIEGDLKGLCDQVCSKLPEGSAGPSFLGNSLPWEGRIPGTEVLIRGPLGLRIRPWAAQIHAEGFREGWLASCQSAEGDAEVLWTKFASQEQASKSFASWTSQSHPDVASALKEDILVFAQGKELPASFLETLCQRILEQGVRTP